MENSERVTARGRKNKKKTSQGRSDAGRFITAEGESRGEDLYPH